MHFRPVVALVACTALLGAAASQRAVANPAEPAVEAAPPLQLSRTLRTFDFEERERGNVEATPEGWIKVEGAGLPSYVGGRLDTRSPAVSGAGTFRFDLDGGSVAYRVRATTAPVMYRAHYRVTTRVRTTPLAVARAQLTAYFADANGRPIRDSIRRSRPVANRSSNVEQFEALSVDVNADDPEAHTLIVELGLLQPALLETVTNVADKLAEDITGTAWFDDVHIAQIPDVTLRTDRPLNVFRSGETPNLRVQVSDRLTADLTADLRIVDAADNAVFQRTGPLRFAAGDSAAIGTPRVGTVPLPALAPGWYSARLLLHTRGQAIEERSLAFVCLGEAMVPERPDPRIGLVATDAPTEVWPQLGDMADTLAAGRVKISVWDRDTNIDGEDTSVGRSFERLADALADRDLSLTACLAAPPAQVRAKIGDGVTGRWTDVNWAARDAWQPQLAFLLARHADSRTDWQFAVERDAVRFAREADYRRAFDRVAAEYKPLMGHAKLTMPWPALYELDNRPLPESVALMLPSSVLPDQIPGYLADYLEGTPARQVSVALQPLDPVRYGRDAQRADLALRVAYALAGGANRIDLPMPFRVSHDPDGNEASLIAPDELMIAQRVIASQLSNATFAGTVSLAPNVDAFVFDRDGEGVMLVRARPGAGPAIQTVNVTLGGDRASLVRLDGSITPLPVGADQTTLDVPVSPMPAFVTGVDGALLRLRANVAIDRPLIESTVGQTSRTLSFTNTFAVPVAGTVRVVGPRGWMTSMPATSFSLNPGEQFRGPISMALPASTAAGIRTLLADLKIETPSGPRRLLIPLSLRVGLSDVGLQCFALRDGDEVVVQQTLTNYGNGPISYTCFAVLPNLARQERVITNLAPGRSAIRKFRFPIKDVVGDRIRTGVREMEGSRMLNQDVEFDAGQDAQLPGIANGRE